MSGHIYPCWGIVIAALRFFVSIGFWNCTDSMIFCIWFYCPRSLLNKLFRYIKGLWTYEIHVALIWMYLAYIQTRTHHCLRRACGQQHFIRLRHALGMKHVISQPCLWTSTPYFLRHRYRNK